MNVYLDHAATTPVDEEVLQAMLPYFGEVYGNASSQHTVGQRAQHAVDRARDAVAEVLGAKPNEIYFTSGGTESDNWALKGVAYANRDMGRHVVVSAVEHHAVLNAASWLQREGWEVAYVPVHADGTIDEEAFAAALRPDTVLASVMTVNNEVGTIEPIARIADICHQRGVLLHTDAVQAVGVPEIALDKLGADLVSLSAHKFYGPKGVGALYVRGGVRIAPLAHGGAQERGLRGGTYNTPAIVGMACALQKAVREAAEDAKRVAAVRDLFEQTVRGAVDCHVNGSTQRRVAANCNLLFDGVRGESVLLSLDLAGVAAGMGSACTAGTTVASHVLTAMGLSTDQALSSLRFTFGKHNTAEEALYAAEQVVNIVRRLRR